MGPAACVKAVTSVSMRPSNSSICGGSGSARVSSGAGVRVDVDADAATAVEDSVALAAAPSSAPEDDPSTDEAMSSSREVAASNLIQGQYKVQVHDRSSTQTS